MTPDEPKDSGVYGTQWGNVGGKKPKQEPADRPDQISTPDESIGTPTPGPSADL